MKKILIILIAVFAISCSNKSESVSLYTAGEEEYTATTSRFNEGDIAYLKPDSLKVVITSCATSVYKGQKRTSHLYYYYYHVTTIEDGTFRKTGRHGEIYFH